MWELDHKESWVPRNWCFWIVVLKTLESILNSKEIKPVNPNGTQLWIFIGRTDAEVEAPILRPPDAKSRLVGEDHDARKDWGQEEKGWHRTRWLDGIPDSMDMGLSKLGRWWRTGRPGALQSMGSRRVGHDWATKEQTRTSGCHPKRLSPLVWRKGNTPTLSVGM